MCAAYASYLKIPLYIHQDDRLTLPEKILLAEIAFLDKSADHCYATNKYLSKLFKVSTRSITRWLRKLKDLTLVEYVECPKNTRIIKSLVKTAYQNKIFSTDLASQDRHPCLASSPRSFLCRETRIEIIYPNPVNGALSNIVNKLSKRTLGTNPRALGVNPRALGTNPRNMRKVENKKNISQYVAKFNTLVQEGKLEWDARMGVFQMKDGVEMKFTDKGFTLRHPLKDYFIDFDDKDFETKMDDLLGRALA